MRSGPCRPVQPSLSPLGWALATMAEVCRSALSPTTTGQVMPAQWFHTHGPWAGEGRMEERRNQRTSLSFLTYSAPSCSSGLASLSPSQEGLSCTRGRIPPPIALCLRTLNISSSASIMSDSYFMVDYLLIICYSLSIYCCFPLLKCTFYEGRDYAQSQARWLAHSRCSININ